MLSRLNWRNRFSRISTAGTPHRFVIQGGSDYATRLLKKAFGEENGKDLAQKVTQATEKRSRQANGCEIPIRRKLAAFLEKEHPQTIALIIAHLEPRMRRQFFPSLPTNYRSTS